MYSLKTMQYPYLVYPDEAVLCFFLTAEALNHAGFYYPAQHYYYVVCEKFVKVMLKYCEI